LHTFLRRTSTKGLTIFFGALAALLTVGAMAAIGASSDSAKPAPKPLDEAVAGSLSGDPIAGVTARIKFTNRLIDSSAIATGSDPLIGGGSGRLWADDKGNVRLELQSDGGGGDLQAVVKGDRIWISHPSSGSVYVLNLPADRSSEHDKPRNADKWPPALTSVRRAITALSGDAELSSAVPDNVGGRPAYSVSVSPNDSGGLLSGADVSWDARNGAPLRIDIRAKGSSEPVLAIEATDVSFGPVDASVFDIAPPSDAKVTDFTGRAQQLIESKKGSSDWKSHPKTKPVTGLEAVQARVGFTIAAPAEAGGLKRSEVMLVGTGDTAGALVTYGTGLGSVLVLQKPADPKPRGSGNSGNDEAAMALPTVKIGAEEATELPTALGTGLTFTRDGIEYALLGSVTPATVEAVARDL